MGGFDEKTYACMNIKNFKDRNVKILTTNLIMSLK